MESMYSERINSANPFSFAQGDEEDSLDPIPQPRPIGTITLVDVVDDVSFIS
jgi:hypothetical protein